MKLPIALLTIFFSSCLMAQEIYIDKGGCPGEGCMYREKWLAITDIPLHSKPDLSSPIVMTLTRGDGVTTTTGEVHTIPGEFIVHRAKGEFTLGDKVFLYTYLGEGWFKIIHNGEVKNADLYFSPWGGNNGKRCEVSDRCWGTLKEELKFFWWVKVKTQDDTEGWTLDTINFEKQSYD